MDGLIISKNLNTIETEGVTSISSNDNAEVMLMVLKPSSLLSIAPEDDSNALEYMYIIEGELEIDSGDKKIRLKAGDSFSIKDIPNPIYVQIKTWTKLLYFSNTTKAENFNNEYFKAKAILEEIEQKDQYTLSHCKRVTHYSLKIAQYLNRRDVNIPNLGRAAQLHDVGKCKIPDEILLKKGFFTPDERKIMKNHATFTKEILSELESIHPDIAHIAACHHERMNGNGYPYGLKGSEIPIESRIIAVADVFDAITSDRPYQKARTPKEAVKEMERFASDFDSDIFKALKQLIKRNVITPDEVQLQASI